MATAVVEERQLLKSLRWWDGFTIALCQPGFLLGSLLGAYGALGVDRRDGAVGDRGRGRASCQFGSTPSRR